MNLEPLAPIEASKLDAQSGLGAGSAALPLCVDLDGTLVKSDTLLDGLCVLARTHPAVLLRLPLWLARGKAALKREVTARAPLDAASLPYNEALILYLRE